MRKITKENISKYFTFINTATGILTMIVQTVVSFFLSPFIVENLGAEANGFAQLANNFVMYASLITIAFNSMAGRFVSVSYHRKEYENAKAYYSTTAICNYIMIGISLPVGCWIVYSLENLINIGGYDIKDVKLVFLFVFVNYFANLILSFLNISLYVKNALYIGNIISLIRNVLNGLILYIIFISFRPKIFYVSMVSLILSIICIPIFCIINRKIFAEITIKAKMFKIELLISVVKSGIWNTINQAGHLLMTGLDLLISNLFISAEAMGELSVAKSIPTTITSLAGVLNSNFAPELTIDWAKGNKEDIIRNLRRNMKISSVIISVPIMTFLVFSKPFYELWVPSMDATRLSILSLLTIMAFIPWAGPQTLYNVFTATNHLKVNSIAFVTTGVINIIIVYVLLNQTNLGVFAIAGVSSSLAIIRNLTLTTVYTAYLLELKWYTFYKDVFISIICCAINLVVGIPWVFIKTDNSWVALIAKVLITCLITIMLDVMFILGKEDRTAVFDRFIKKRI